jgi:thioredoxin 1
VRRQNACRWQAQLPTRTSKAKSRSTPDWPWWTFWAAWCGPCRIIAPILDQLATEYSGKAKVAKLDVDANIRTATRFNVRSIPMVIFFKDGKVVDQVIGAVPRPVLEEKFKKHAA